jgi:Zn-finger protein
MVSKDVPGTWKKRGEIVESCTDCMLPPQRETACLSVTCASQFASEASALAKEWRNKRSEEKKSQGVVRG